MKEGWKCPQCEKIYGPHVDECAECNENRDTSLLEEYKKLVPLIPPIQYIPYPVYPQPYRHPWDSPVWVGVGTGDPVPASCNDETW